MSIFVGHATMGRSLHVALPPYLFVSNSRRRQVHLRRLHLLLHRHQSHHRRLLLCLVSLAGKAKFSEKSDFKNGNGITLDFLSFEKENVGSKVNALGGGISFIKKVNSKSGTSWFFKILEICNNQRRSLLGGRKRCALPQDSPKSPSLLL